MPGQRQSALQKIPETMFTHPQYWERHHTTVVTKCLRQNSLAISRRTRYINEQLFQKMQKDTKTIQFDMFPEYNHQQTI